MAWKGSTSPWPRQEVRKTTQLTGTLDLAALDGIFDYLHDTHTMGQAGVDMKSNGRDEATGPNLS